ncbi:MAG: trypsin-like peptidase domain-containing protein [Rubrivivax sp.]|nr:trypsin-like peptidase domain-containing protein [Rubrivivax sp.]
MKAKAPLYSRSPRRAQVGPGLVPLPAPPADAGGDASGAEGGAGTVASSAPETAGRPKTRRARLGAVARRWQGPLWGLAGATLAVLVSAGMLHVRAPRVITQDDIDAAVRESIEREPLPSQATKAYEAIAPSLVRVVGLMSEDDTGETAPEKKAMDRSLGSGVVIVANGTILTNLHVVWGAKKIRVRFHNGEESEATMVGAMPENDLAVLKAVTPPAELEPATMRSTGDLRPGDHVVAAGFPFGIGPSVSYGVVSGLKREFRSPDGGKTLTNLIQFDAAANPGNSGGPLITMDGAVVGIVTAILNPNEQRTFIGIGFAVPIENAASAAGLPPF